MAPRRRVMTPKQFGDLLKAAELGQTAAAEKLGVGRRTVIRWLNGESGIYEGTLLLIRSKIQPKK